MAATCGTGSADWFSTGTLHQPYEKVFDTTRELLEKSHRFRIETADRQSGEIVTQWKVTLSPHWREGKRDRVEVEILRDPGGTIQVRIRTPREFNDNGRNPMIEREADWTSEGGNNELSERIGLQLRMRLKGLKLDD